MQDVRAERSDAFISPFSSQRYREVVWQTVSSRWRGIEKAAEWADLPVLEYLREVGFAVRSQLLPNFYGNPGNGKKRLERMARTGVLLRHALKNGTREAALYTLGPVGAGILDTRWLPNWWRSVPLSEVLKRLVAGELLLSIRKERSCEFLPARFPLTAYLVFGGMEYGVIVLRDDVEAVRRKIGKHSALRLIVVAEQMGDAVRLASVLEAPARFTFDRNILNRPFGECVFYRWDEGGMLVPEAHVSQEQAVL